MDDNHEENFRFGYIYASPLAQTGKDFEEAVQLLDYKMEMRSILEVLKNTKKKVAFKSDIATVQNLSTLLREGCDILHFTGHGSPDELAFEYAADDYDFSEYYGSSKLVHTSYLQNLFKAGLKLKDSENLHTQLVFVSACSSECIGLALAEAGVRHVIAVKWSEQIKDEVARGFASKFYETLLIGNGSTVLDAFKMAKACTEARWAGEPFIVKLLPEEANHDNYLIGSNRAGSCINETRLLPQMVSCPAVRDAFYGRGLDMFLLVRHLVLNFIRCITIQGPSGIGKTQLAIHALHYIQERRVRDFFFFVSLQSQQKKCDFSNADELCEHIGCALNMGQIGRPIKPVDIVRFLWDRTQCNEHNPVWTLLVLDGLNGSENVIYSVVNDLLKLDSHLYLLVTAEKSICRNGQTFQSTSEYCMNLKSLSGEDSMLLFGKLFHRKLHKVHDLNLKISASDEECTQCIIKHVLRITDGYPGEIVKLAGNLKHDPLAYYDSDNFSKKTELLTITRALLDTVSTSSSLSIDGSHNYSREWIGRFSKFFPPVSKPEDSENLEMLLKIPSFTCRQIWMRAFTNGPIGNTVAWLRLQQLIQSSFIGVNSGYETRGKSEYFDGPYAHCTEYLKSVTLPRPLVNTDFSFIKACIFGNLAVTSLVTLPAFVKFCSLHWSHVLRTLDSLWEEWDCRNPVLVYGILDRTGAKNVLSNQPTGTFILRLNLNCPHHIVVSFVAEKFPGKISYKNVQIKVEQGGSCSITQLTRCVYPCLRDLIIECQALKFMIQSDGTTVSKEEAWSQISARR